MSKNEQGADEQPLLLGALLRVPYQRLTIRIQEGLLADGHPEFHASHLRVLQHIQPAGNGLGELAEQAQMSKQALNYLIEYLEEHGYVQRKPDPHDGRARKIYLTDLGKQVEKRAREIIIQTEREWSEHLGQDRVRDLVQTLRDLVVLLEKEGDL